MANYYISPTGNDTTGNGSEANPWYNLNKAWGVSTSGDTIYMRGGIYLYDTQQEISSKSGTSGNTINIYNYPNETPIISRSASYFQPSGLTIGVKMANDSYIHIKGITISGFTQQNFYPHNTSLISGFFCDNINNCIFEQLDVCWNGQGMKVGNNSGDNYIINCDFHHNQDPYTSSDPPYPGPYNNADGLSYSFITGAAASKSLWVSGCRFWWNSDDGMDTYNNDQDIYVDNCWSFYHGYIPGTFTSVSGNGNGYKLGPTTSMPTTVRRHVTRCISAKNKTSGFATTSSRCVFHFYNNLAFNEGHIGFHTSDDGYGEHMIHVLHNNISTGCTYNSYQSVYDDDSYNTFRKVNSTNTGYTLSSADFVSLDDTQLLNPRKSDGSLPDITFAHLVQNSDLRNSGINVGLPYFGIAPDLGPFEQEPRVIKYITTSVLGYNNKLIGI